MNFWDTVGGQNFTESVQHSLREISKSLKKVTEKPVKKQKSHICGRPALNKYLNEEFEAGRTFVNVSNLGGDFFLVITEG